LIFPFLKLNFKTCLFYPKKHNKKWLNKIKPCTFDNPNIKIISMGNDFIKNSNAGSIIYLINDKILISGDSPKSEEKKWLYLLPHKLFLLILGHHGSRTSTSKELLNWAKPEIAIASARKEKYGHPHFEVISNLKNKNIPLLRTETFGNIYFQIP
jgi:beta-lactamase superfamily II metal-dependent hydrolase